MPYKGKPMVNSPLDSHDPWKKPETSEKKTPGAAEFPCCLGGSVHRGSRKTTQRCEVRFLSCWECSIAFHSWQLPTPRRGQSPSAEKIKFWLVLNNFEPTNRGQTVSSHYFAGNFDDNFAVAKAHRFLFAFYMSLFWCVWPSTSWNHQSGNDVLQQVSFSTRGWSHRTTWQM